MFEVNGETRNSSNEMLRFSSIVCQNRQYYPSLRGSNFVLLLIIVDVSGWTLLLGCSLAQWTWMMVDSNHPPRGIKNVTNACL
jgi:hypothetical protein